MNSLPRPQIWASLRKLDLTHQFCHLATLLLSLLALSQPCAAADQRTGLLVPVPAIQQRPEWNRFLILVWQHKTSILSDLGLYRKVGLRGFHIDRGSDQGGLVEFSLKNNLPYYVDHAADKGFLYLQGDSVGAVTGKRGLVTRPHSLANPETIVQLQDHLSRNVRITKKGLALAYAFDDEISLGRFVTPCDVDIHPLSLAWFRQWLVVEYTTIARLNAQWHTSFESFEEVMPQGFEQVRHKHRTPPLAQWNLSPWMDFRRFMDFQFARVLADLTRYTNSLDPRTPAGFVGGQGPGPWGGYDYGLLSRAVQWLEAYDVNGTNEILRSFWGKQRRPRMQTFFSTKKSKLDSWFLWYHLLHGNQGIIAWPEGWFRASGHEIAPHILSLKDTFAELQGKISEPIVNPETVFAPDPIGIYYSHPSIQAGWAMDAITHGKTWINRNGSIDNNNQTKGVLRKVWCKTLEDLGYQYDFINYLDVKEGSKVQGARYRVIILPRTICLSDVEAEALRRFVAEGGILIADALCGLLDEHGKGRDKGALDDLFGVIRDESAGYMNGKGITEIDGEKYQKPFLERFTYYDGACRYKGIVVFERGTKHGPDARGAELKGRLGLFHRTSALIEKQTSKGRTYYLNLSPLEYWEPSNRFSEYGHNWRTIVSSILTAAGLKPRVKVYERGNPVNMIEALVWKNGDNHFLGLVKNPADNKEIKPIGGVQGITGEQVEIQIEFPEIVALVNLRTHQHLGVGRVFGDRFRPWEGNLYQVIYED